MKEKNRDKHDENERSSRVATRSPLPPEDSQRATTSGETSANRGSNQTREELSRDGRSEVEPRFEEHERSSQGGSRSGENLDEQKRR